MPGPASFDYAVVRIVPRVEREEFLNVGVIVFSAARRYLACRIELPEERLRAFAPRLGAHEVELLRCHVDGFRGVCQGDKACGPIARLPPSERFHWLVAPRSTVVQTSRVHTGLTEAPERTLDQLFEKLVGPSGA